MGATGGLFKDRILGIPQGQQLNSKEGYGRSKRGRGK